jgi:hypothetical protein
MLFVVSWLPIAQVVIAVSRHYGRLTSESSANEVRLVIWGIQWAIGFVGLWLAGKVAVQAAREDGWRHLGANLWRLFWTGEHRSTPPTPGPEGLQDPEAPENLRREIDGRAAEGEVVAE